MKQEQVVLRRYIQDLMTSMTTTNRQHSEVVSSNQRLTFVQERLDNMDSQVKEVATAEVGRRTHLLRRRQQPRYD
ncbi:hypothetical protein DPMN_190769 [Dreissena polymorpha]|uniref:Uncharacterized protein n=1 Tax=Dreissena polymorpha TaxID=45954 RepID=A0A9D3Y4A7_DREPO|nr:hypothetical protein DPMN_190769 [Dreissena polymorpha]